MHCCIENDVLYHVSLLAIYENICIDVILLFPPDGSRGATI